MQPTNFVWHYTVGTRLPAIPESGLADSRKIAACHGVAGRVVVLAAADLGAVHGPHWLEAAPGRQDRVPGERGPVPLRPAGLGQPPGVVAHGHAPGRYRHSEAMAMVSAGLRRGATPTDWVGVLTQVPLAELRCSAGTAPHGGIRDWRTSTSRRWPRYGRCCRPGMAGAFP
ncbi:hypothetical protein ACTMU2_18690 [Cupriavidus basilensis]